MQTRIEGRVGRVSIGPILSTDLSGAGPCVTSSLNHQIMQTLKTSVDIRIPATTDTPEVEAGIVLSGAAHAAKDKVHVPCVVRTHSARRH